MTQRIPKDGGSRRNRKADAKINEAGAKQWDDKQSLIEKMKSKVKDDPRPTEGDTES